LYGALLNEHCRFYDKRLGQSVTLTGRQITKHMNSEINDVIAGAYDHEGDAMIYADSVTGDTIIRTDDGDKTIKQLFDECMEHSISGSKEYGLWTDAKVVGFSAFNMEPTVSNIEYVMRHKTKKKLFKITTENGKSVTVTEDHSVMIDRDGELLECKPTEILETDLLITFVP